MTRELRSTLKNLKGLFEAFRVTLNNVNISGSNIKDLKMESEVLGCSLEDYLKFLKEIGITREDIERWYLANFKTLPSGDVVLKMLSYCKDNKITLGSNLSYDECEISINDYLFELENIEGLPAKAPGQPDVKPNLPIVE